MPGFNTNPFDDASGHGFLNWFADKGGFPTNIKEVTPEGTALDDATPISLGLSLVRAAVSGAGVRAPAGAPIGALMMVANVNGSNPIKIWPSSETESINILSGVAPGEAENISSLSIGFYIKAFNDEWIAWYY